MLINFDFLRMFIFCDFNYLQKFVDIIIRVVNYVVEYN